MNIMNLEDKLYTSTEVADILGVSLRSVYRYLEEGKLDAEVKTATGRHRFTRQNILDFLYPSGERPAAPVREQRAAETAQAPRPEVREQPAQPTYAPQTPPTPPVAPAPRVEPVAETPRVEEEVEEPIDWLEKFRAAANKYKEQDAVITKEEKTTIEVDSLTSTPIVEEKPAEPAKKLNYYRSLMGGLKDIAQNIDKSAKKASIDYAFTMNAGLSLHKPIKPFSLLHVYIRPEDREFFERMLNLVSADENNAQLCLITTKEARIFDTKKEMHGLSVVADNQLKTDLYEMGEEQLARELDTVLTA
jgi:hypothetical protein